MSAGDVLFVGWTGGTPNYKEIEPTIRYEPVRENETFVVNNQQTTFPANYTRKIAMRKLICFTKDLQSVISSVIAYSGSLKSVYIDTDGSAKELDLGPGWKLLNYDSSKYALGFSLVQISYEKIIEFSADAALPEDMSITCTNGICSIKYKNTILEELDSGTGKCKTGFNILYNKFDVPSDPDIAQDSKLFSATILCNGVKFDTVEIVGNEIVELEEVVESKQTNYPAQIITVYPASASIVSGIFKVGSYVHQFENIAEAIQWLNDVKNEIKKLTDEDTAYLKSLSSQFPKTNYLEYKNFNIKTEVTFEYVSDFTAEIIWRRFLTYDIVKKIPSVTALTPSAYWEKDGNIIRLKLLDKIWREYDVTGLT